VENQSTLFNTRVPVGCLSKKRLQSPSLPQARAANHSKHTRRYDRLVDLDRSDGVDNNSDNTHDNDDDNTNDNDHNRDGDDDDGSGDGPVDAEVDLDDSGEASEMAHFWVIQVRFLCFFYRS
jgi:hypothetical protein